MPDKDQVFIYNDAQLSLIQNTFAENDTLLYTIRKVFLQFPLTPVEKGLIQTAVTPEVVEILKIRLLPEIAPSFPLTQLPSILTTLQTEMKENHVDLMEPLFDAKVKEIAYLEQQFNKLQNLELEEMLTLKQLGSLMGKNPYERYVDMTAYLFLLGYIDPGLNMIKVIAGTKNENVEEKKKRLKRDSSR